MSRTIAPITGRYRTKPIEVEAIRWTGEDNCEDVFAFLGIEHVGDDGFYEVFTDTAFQAKFEAADHA